MSKIVVLNEDAGRAPFGGVQLMIYDYEYSDWSGTGNAIYKTDAGKWGHEYLGHCSCNGPFEDFNPADARFNTLQDILDNSSKDQQKELMRLIETARALGEV